MCLLIYSFILSLPFFFCLCPPVCYSHCRPDPNFSLLTVFCLFMLFSSFFCNLLSYFPLLCEHLDIVTGFSFGGQIYLRLLVGDSTGVNLIPKLNKIDEDLRTNVSDSLGHKKIQRGFIWTTPCSGFVTNIPSCRITMGLGQGNLSSLRCTYQKKISGKKRDPCG